MQARLATVFLNWFLINNSVELEVVLDVFDGLLHAILLLLVLFKLSLCLEFVVVFRIDLVLLLLTSFKTGLLLRFNLFGNVSKKINIKINIDMLNLYYSFYYLE